MIFNFTSIPASEPAVLYDVQFANSYGHTGTWDGTSFTQTDRVEYEAGETVYVALSRSRSKFSSSPSVSVTTVQSGAENTVYSFIMPDDAEEIWLYIEIHGE